ncbi:DotI/IcmL family type IV secretion protein [Pseudomonas sp. EMN2]|uniref:DotI/IcmL family type IV secretion protein n=1 Tax=Pseudomonas sp. EMN2 TaxID=2615212 RepID=UPI0015B3EFE4|nr:DotI/IcmL family type IV secretion protein [Pseudomonas sp. EMN2]
MADHAEQNASSKMRGLEEKVDALLDMHGMLALLESGETAQDSRTIKNRVIAGLFVLLAGSMAGNAYQYYREPEVKIIGETPDGRFREIPALNVAIYNEKQILEWSSKCVESIYRLSYVDWESSINNNSFCLSDGGRKSFKDSLVKVGLTKYLNNENQGTIYAVTSTASIMKAQTNPRAGYSEWIVRVPYRVNIDGRQRGTLDVEMTMKIRRVSFLIRGDGLWVESYVVRPR